MKVSTDMCQIIQAALKPFMLKVILRGGSDNVDFRGFMIQGRMKADDSVVGNFVVGSKYQTQCDGVRSIRTMYLQTLCYMCTQSAATHTNNNEKTTVILFWAAPPLGTGPVEFRSVD